MGCCAFSQRSGFGVKQLVLLSLRWCPAALQLLCLLLFAGASPLIRAQIPQIVSQPESLSVLSGDTAAFSVEVSGAEPLSYRWLQNGTNYPGGASRDLTIT